MPACTYTEPNRYRRAPFWHTVTLTARSRPTRIALWFLGAALWFLGNKVVRLLLADLIIGAIIVGVGYLLGVSGIMLTC